MKKKENYKYESFIPEEETKEASSVFCPTFAKEIKYSYRVGHCKFKSSNGYKIAEGEYDISSILIEDRGGCSCRYIKNSIAPERWLF